MGSGPAKRLEGWLSALLFIGLLTNQVTGQCQIGRAESALEPLACISASEWAAIRDFDEPPRGDARAKLALTTTALRRTLEIADRAAECLTEAPPPVLYTEKWDRLCLQQAVLDVYEKVGDNRLFADDRLDRAALSFQQCAFPEPDGSPSSPPDETPTSRDCATLVGRALIDYRAVFGGARQMIENPGSYASQKLAEKLGMDILNPAPKASELDRFVELGSRVASEHPEFGLQIGSALGPSLCDAMVIYPRRRDEIADLYNLLIRLDAGNLAVSGTAYRLFRSLGQLFPQARLRWTSVGEPCSAGRGLLKRPEFTWAPSQLDTVDFEALSAVFRTAERLKLVLANGRPPDRGGVQNRANAWIPLDAYAAFLYRISELIRPASHSSPEIWDRRWDLLTRSCDALVMAVAVSRPVISDPDLRQVQDRLGAQIQEFGRELLGDSNFADMAKFGCRYLDTQTGFGCSALGAEPAVEGAVDWLDSVQKQKLHGLLAKAFLMQGESTVALQHVRESDISISELREYRDKLQDFAIGIPRKPK